MSKSKRTVNTQERSRSRGRSLCARVGEAFHWVGVAARSGAGDIAATRPVQVDHFGLFRWPGPLNCTVKIGGRVPERCFSTRVVSFAEADFVEAVAAGFEWVEWAHP